MNRENPTRSAAKKLALTGILLAASWVLLREHLVGDSAGLLLVGALSTLFVAAALY